ncbi:hypothetical protein WDU94_000686 [Cyamophila willieti]
MGDDGGYGDSSGGNGGGWGGNNNYADSYNNYSYSNDTNDFSNKYSSYNDSKEDKHSTYNDNKNEESRVYSMVKQIESSKPYDEVAPKTYDETRANFAETPRSEQNNTSTPIQENNTSNPTSDVANSSPVVSSESHSSKTEKPQESKKEEKDGDDFGDDDDDDEVTAGHESEHEAAELQALESLHDACKCNGGSNRTAADDINLDDTRENTDLLNDSSETQPLEDGKKPDGDEDDCLINVLSFCVTCCECVIS